ncbi:conserved hypothetical protein [Desulfofarcimen acetoxidans DSM 771]|uniref:Type III secretion exporter n=1 Tax=Desulfofarcimen acetoxidans (strain ATCC 49208 / DSM 771 / KCTC 5769 / VKM B-1644 / 5575) TaxID=485916 RepID=C8W0C2_DESAS|nr:EscU/YscU/HrcU family type III secretion system export apparatus switch protein [Desulfofarcimen acetoxidans]ACV63177.1 conserved hypothetical protein [Desulfofarcimen acetoxidans DSM 771]
MDKNKPDQDKKTARTAANTVETASALRFDPNKDQAPVVVATGKGDIARSIKKMAGELHIPIVKDPVLAQTLHTLGTNIEIPEHLYEAVAKVLAYVYEIDQANKK